MPRRTDANQQHLVKLARTLGASVFLLHEVGQGCPDALVGFGGRNILWEIKSETGKLTPDEKDWHRNWKGEAVWVVRTDDDVYRSLGLQVWDRQEALEGR